MSVMEDWMCGEGRPHLAVGGDESGGRLPSSLPENVVLKICPVQLETRHRIRTRDKNLETEGNNVIFLTEALRHTAPI